MQIHLLAIAPNMQKWYTLTGIQRSMFVWLWRGIAPNGLFAAIEMSLPSLTEQAAAGV